MIQYFLLWIILLVSMAPAGTTLVYFGTYAGGENESKGIYASWFDQETGKLSDPFLAAETKNPSFLEIHPNGKFLYAVSEAGGAGIVKSYEIDSQTGKLKFLNEQSSNGEGPCHMSTDSNGKNLLVANYGSGSAAVLPIGPDGKLTESTGFAQHKGSSVNPKRQKEPHAHSINVSPDNHFAFVADLGIDKVMIYALNIENGTIRPNDPAFVQLEPGSGPRHFSFHPNGLYAYVINELTCTITVFDYTASSGSLAGVQTITTFPADFKGSNTCAEIRVHPNGKFLYGSNRGHDSIAIYRIDQKEGRLILTGHMTEGIKTPRNFNIDPGGQYCLVANQGNGTVIVFRIDQKSGKLMSTGSAIAISKPVCIRFLEQ